MSQTITDESVGADRMPFPERLKAAVIEFLDDYSIEATPHAVAELESCPQYLASGTTVYVAHPPRSSLGDVVNLACRLRMMGYTAVPHIAVRRIESESVLVNALSTLRAAGVDRALVIGGDLPEPAGPYDSALQLLESGLLSAHDFHTIGFAGHPEGSRTIGPIMLRTALVEKIQFAIETGLRPYIVTQFGFNPAAVIEWEASTRASGVDVPIRVGMAGLVPLKELLRYAIRCGISSSMRLLVSKTSALAEHAKLTSVDELVLTFAQHKLENPDTAMSRAHFFAFGGMAQTANWITRVRSGDFDIDLERHSILFRA